MNEKFLHVYFLFYCLACPLGCICHSISVVVKQRQSFAVKDTWEPDFIDLPKAVEEELKFEPNMKGSKSRLTFDDKVENQSDDLNTDTDVADMETTEDFIDYPSIEDFHLDNPTEEFIDDDGDDDVASSNQAAGKIYDGSKDDDFNNDDDDFDDDESNKGYRIDNSTDDDDDDDIDDDDIHSNDMVEPSKDRTIKEIKEDMSNDNIDARETKTPNLDLLDADREDRIVEHVYKVMKRKKRAVKEQWRNSLHGTEESQSKDKLLTSDVWEDVTDEELDNIQKQQYIRLAKYIGWTLLSVVFFVLVGICFLRDPVACIFSFGTGCPCCLIICPCIRGFVRKHLDFKRMIRDAMNKYTPGVIVHEDGSIQHYEPTAEEVEYLKELLDEITGQAVV